MISHKFSPNFSVIAALVMFLWLPMWGTFTPFGPGPAEARPLHSGLSISQSAASTVYNGDWITYTLTIANSGVSVKEIYVEDQLPAGVLANAQCLTEVGNCSIEYDTTSVTVRNGGTVQVSQPTRVKWSFVSATALPHAFPLSLRFRAQVLCQPVGSQFSNQATMTYKDTGNNLGFAISDPLFLDTAVAQAPIEQVGHFSLSPAPELCTKSGPVGGTTDMDWGDFDNDGDLDLALVSWDGGVFVYRNKGQGQFEMFWNGSVHPAESVQWADFDGKSNGYLELVVGGDFSATTSPTPDGGSYGYTGKNYLYQFNGSDAFSEYDQFETNDGVWRAAAADFSGDGYPDLAMLNARGGCAVHLYKNDQTGKFNRSDPGSTVSSYCLLGPPYDSTAKAYSAAWGDVDNDGDPDLAVGHNYVSGSVTTLIRVYKNNSGVLAPTNNIEIENVVNPAANFRYAQDLAWGDYDGDGDLDLAVAFASDTYLDFTGSSSGGLRVYSNDGSSFNLAFSTTAAGAVGALDWADFDGDGEIELVIAETGRAPKIYKFRGGTFSLQQSLDIAGQGAVLAIRGVDFDNENDLDIAFTNFLAENWLFSNKAPFLQQYAKGLVSSFVSHSVDWGDVNNDGSLDLMYGTDSATKLYHNNGDGTFFGGSPFSPNPLARSVALADVEGDGDLDMVLGPNGQNFLYRNNGGTFSSLPVWIAAPSDNTYSQLFIDVNQDNLGRPDLVVGNNGNPNRLYINLGSTLNAAPAWQSQQDDSTYSVAWGYLDDDILPDLATADGDQGVRLYRNTGYDRFEVAQLLSVSAAQSVTWGDYDGDGDQDLAVGRYGQPNLLYQNSDGALSLVWTAPMARQTTSLAWGDWNNDGDLDLAVGNFNQKDQVYDNLDSTVSQVSLVWLWEAAVNYNTTALRWIDYDGDGDLDLSLAQESVNDPNGIYENSTVAAAHQVADFTDRVLLPRVPSYVSIAQPGYPGQLFKRTNSTISATLTIPLTISAFDPDTSRQFNSNQSGNVLKVTGYQYSLDGGGRWYNATVSPTLSVITPARRGVSYTTAWLAGKDMTVNNPNQAVSDEVRLRLTVSQQNTPTRPYQIAGPTQRVDGGAVSPPFRVRNISCIWPEGPYIASMQPSPPITPGIIRLWGAVQQWDMHTSGITYTWDFGDATAQGVFVDHTYTTAGTHAITMTVAQSACPNTRFDFVTTTVVVTGTNSLLSNVTYLPLIIRTGSGSSAPAAKQLAPQLGLASAALPQVTGLRGEIGSGGTVLRWNPAVPAEASGGYRLYRSEADTISYQPVAELPASVTTFTDSAVTCGYAYFVTVFDERGQSYPSTASFYQPACP